MHNEWKTRAGRQLSWEERIKEGWGVGGGVVKGVGRFGGGGGAIRG